MKMSELSSACSCCSTDSEIDLNNNERPKRSKIPQDLKPEEIMAVRLEAFESAYTVGVEYVRIGAPWRTLYFGLIFSKNKCLNKT